MRLPLELRYSILDFILPLDRYDKKTITLGIRQRRSNEDWRTDRLVLVADISPSRLSLRRFLLGIGLVNRQLHRECNKLFYDRAFVIDISEHTFWESGDPICMLRYARNNALWEWESLLPGLDLSRIKELRITIEPSDYPGFWPCLQHATKTFCLMLDWRLGNDRLERLVIGVEETKETMAYRSPVPLWGGEPTDATIDDVRGVVRVFQGLKGHAKKWKITVPGWASKYLSVLDAIADTGGLFCSDRKVISKPSSVARPKETIDINGIETKKADLWAKIEHDTWDDFYALPPPEPWNPSGWIGRSGG